MSSWNGIQTQHDLRATIRRMTTFNSGVARLKTGVGSVISISSPVSSMSVESVPFEDGAIGEGSGISVGLDVTGEDWFGG